MQMKVLLRLKKLVIRKSYFNNVFEYNINWNLYLKFVCKCNNDAEIWTKCFCL